MKTKIKNINFEQSQFICAWLLALVFAHWCTVAPRYVLCVWHPVPYSPFVNVRRTPSKIIYWHVHQMSNAKRFANGWHAVVVLIILLWNHIDIHRARTFKEILFFGRSFVVVVVALILGIMRTPNVQVNANDERKCVGELCVTSGKCGKRGTWLANGLPLNWHWIHHRILWCQIQFKFWHENRKKNIKWPRSPAIDQRCNVGWRWFSASTFTSIIGDVACTRQWFFRLRIVDANRRTSSTMHVNTRRRNGRITRYTECRTIFCNHTVFNFLILWIQFGHNDETKWRIRYHLNLLAPNFSFFFVNGFSQLSFFSQILPLLSLLIRISSVVQMPQFSFCCSSFIVGSPFARRCQWCGEYAKCIRAAQQQPQEPI